MYGIPPSSAAVHRFYQSIEIRSGPIAAALPAHAAPPSAALSSPLLATALLLSAAWAGVTALFARNYGLTTFGEASRWKLLAAWPYLAAFSSKFRAQFVSALRSSGRSLSARCAGKRST